MRRGCVIAVVCCVSLSADAALPADAFKPAGAGVYVCELGPLGLGQGDRAYGSGGWAEVRGCPQG